MLGQDVLILKYRRIYFLSSSEVEFLCTFQFWRYITWTEVIRWEGNVSKGTKSYFLVSVRNVQGKKIATFCDILIPRYRILFHLSYFCLRSSHLATKCFIVNSQVSDFYCYMAFNSVVLLLSFSWPCLYFLLLVHPSVVSSA